MRVKTPDQEKAVERGGAENERDSDLTETTKRKLGDTGRVAEVVSADEELNGCFGW